MVTKSRMAKKRKIVITKKASADTTGIASVRANRNQVVTPKKAISKLKTGKKASLSRHLVQSKANSKIKTTKTSSVIMKMISNRLLKAAEKNRKPSKIKNNKKIGKIGFRKKNSNIIKPRIIKPCIKTEKKSDRGTDKFLKNKLNTGLIRSKPKALTRLKTVKQIAKRFISKANKTTVSSKKNINIKQNKTSILPKSYPRIKKPAVPRLSKEKKVISKSQPGPEIETVVFEKEKKHADFWSDCGQLFFTAGKAYGLTDGLRTICVGNRLEVQNFLLNGKIDKKLNEYQKNTLLRIREHISPKADSNKTIDNQANKPKSKIKVLAKR